VLEIGRDLAERNEFVAFVIRRVVNPGLQAALGVHRGCRWVDPPGGHKDQRGQPPNKHYADGKTSNQGAKETFSKRGLVAWGWPCSHVSEYQPGLDRRLWLTLRARRRSAAFYPGHSGQIPGS